ncbi:hypothetical protein [Phytomonospora endophytica]|uniref:Tight adherence protein B n=1 Tax=Phytomonospora endophytica TaxID=714109 RepID=A0A841FKH6_9ACTN|nr:hypothetical protein [Phytomonospora endophytica]MBB6035433.1 tight adherence protein B [Phytomonospora endophytica]GIG63815.1 hypothetical protein Pen01_01100 [Phytomonospora endophytica]
MLSTRTTRVRARLAALGPAVAARPSAKDRLKGLSPLRSRRAAAAALALAGFAAFAWQGPVAAFLAFVYGTAGLLALHRSRRVREAAVARERTRGAITLLAADLRAGVPAHRAVHEVLAALPAVDDPLCRTARRRLRAAWQVADTTGAACADILDRLDADLRARLRRDARAAVHVSGSRATTVLLAALPAAGLLLGSALGGDVLGVLFHTPVGAVCASAAVALQLLGLTWSRRLTAPKEVPS